MSRQGAARLISGDEGQKADPNSKEAVATSVPLASEESAVKASRRLTPVCRLKQFDLRADVHAGADSPY